MENTYSGGSCFIMLAKVSVCTTRIKVLFNVSIDASSSRALGLSNSHLMLVGVRRLDFRFDKNVDSTSANRSLQDLMISSVVLINLSDGKLVSRTSDVCCKTEAKRPISRAIVSICFRALIIVLPHSYSATDNLAPKA